MSMTASTTKCYLQGVHVWEDSDHEYAQCDQRLRRYHVRDEVDGTWFESDDRAEADQQLADLAARAEANGHTLRVDDMEA